MARFELPTARPGQVFHIAGQNGERARVEFQSWEIAVVSVTDGRGQRTIGPVKTTFEAALFYVWDHGGSPVPAAFVRN